MTHEDKTINESELDSLTEELSFDSAEDKKAYFSSIGLTRENVKIKFQDEFYKTQFILKSHQHIDKIKNIIQKDLSILAIQNILLPKVKNQLLSYKKNLELNQYRFLPTFSHFGINEHGEVNTIEIFHTQFERKLNLNVSYIRYLTIGLHYKFINSKIFISDIKIEFPLSTAQELKKMGATKEPKLKLHKGYS